MVFKFGFDTCGRAQDFLRKTPLPKNRLKPFANWPKLYDPLSSSPPPHRRHEGLTLTNGNTQLCPQNVTNFPCQPKTKEFQHLSFRPIKAYTDYFGPFLHTRPILESKGMRAIFQKRGKKMLKKGKIFENLGKNVQNLKIGQVIACDIARNKLQEKALRYSFFSFVGFF